MTSTQIPAWAAALFTTPVAPLQGGPVLAVAGAAPGGGISEQFQSGAGDYHARYGASAHFEAHYRQALAGRMETVGPAPLVLDLGSGSGVNSVVPCLRLFSDPRIVATDLSAELLAMLAADLPRLGAEDRVACVVMDAMSRHVAPGAFDLVTGSVILHHLPHPRVGLHAAARALKPGGTAVFLEPFDGYALMRLAYQRILAERSDRSPRLDPPIEDALRALAADIAARVAPDIHAPGFLEMDDKWLFAPEHLTRAAQANGFGDVKILAHNDHPSLYRDTALVQLRLATGQAEPELPPWALSILDEFDAAIPMVAKRRMLLEGTIVLTRSDQPVPEEPQSAPPLTA